MKNFTHQTVIRNGNHFIRLQGDYGKYLQDRWMLIDGPWFEYLEITFKNYDEVHLAPYQKMVSVPIDEEYYFEFLEADCRRDHTVWARREKALTGKDIHLFQKTQNKEWLYQKLLKYRNLKEEGYLGNVFVNATKATVSFYTQLVWWECNGGVLPAWIKNPEWDEDLEELFTYTTYQIEEEFK